MTKSVRLLVETEIGYHKRWSVRKHSSMVPLNRSLNFRINFCKYWNDRIRYPMKVSYESIRLGSITKLLKEDYMETFRFIEIIPPNLPFIWRTFLNRVILLIHYNNIGIVKNTVTFKIFLTIICYTIFPCKNRYKSKLYSNKLKR